MIKKFLVYVISLFLFGFSGTVRADNLSQEYQRRYRICVEKQKAGYELDYNVCKTYTDQITYKNNGCKWYGTSAYPCMFDVLTEVSRDGRDTAKEFSILERKFAGGSRPTTHDNPTTTTITTTTTFPAPVPKTGQTKKYADGDDGDLEKGVAWPNPRFTDNGNGTVTDNLTGLIWLKNANCFGTRTWANALSDCNGLASGSCGLSDGSSAGDWRLPNLKELESLIHYGSRYPTLPNTKGTGHWTEGDPFTDVKPSFYWSSTTYESDATLAWCVSTDVGTIVGFKSDVSFVWPVRGGQ